MAGATLYGFNVNTKGTGVQKLILGSTTFGVINRTTFSFFRGFSASLEKINHATSGTGGGIIGVRGFPTRDI